MGVYKIWPRKEGDSGNGAGKKVRSRSSANQTKKKADSRIGSRDWCACLNSGFLPWMRAPRPIRVSSLEESSQTQQTGVYPYPLVAGSARPNPKMGAPDPENPLFLGFFVLRGGRDHGLRPWSRKGPDHGVGVDPETVTDQCSSLLSKEGLRTC